MHQGVATIAGEGQFTSMSRDIIQMKVNASYRMGITPTEKRHLGTAHTDTSYSGIIIFLRLAIRIRIAMNKVRETTFLVPGVALFLFGMSLTIGWNVFGWIGGARLSSIEFPMATDLVAAADSVGRIYIGDSYYGRIQRYSAAGQFERGWFVDFNGGVFALRITDGNEVEVAASRQKSLFVYSSNGELLRVINNVKLYQDFYAIDIKARYGIEGWLIPQVVDKKSRRVLIATPWYKRVIAWPFPSMAYSAVGFALVAIGSWQRRRRVKEAGQTGGR